MPASFPVSCWADGCRPGACDMVISSIDRCMLPYGRGRRSHAAEWSRGKPWLIRYACVSVLCAGPVARPRSGRPDQIGVYFDTDAGRDLHRRAGVHPVHGLRGDHQPQFGERLGRRQVPPRRLPDAGRALGARPDHRQHRLRAPGGDLSPSQCPGPVDSPTSTITGATASTSVHRADPARRRQRGRHGAALPVAHRHHARIHLGPAPTQSLEDGLPCAHRRRRPDHSAGRIQRRSRPAGRLGEWRVPPRCGRERPALRSGSVPLPARSRRSTVAGSRWCTRAFILRLDKICRILSIRTFGAERSGRCLRGTSSRSSRIGRPARKVASIRQVPANERYRAEPGSGLTMGMSKTAVSTTISVMCLLSVLGSAALAATTATDSLVVKRPQFPSAPT